MKKSGIKKNRFFCFLKGVVYYPFKLLYPTTVVGRHNFVKGKSITVSNHLKWTDVFLIYLYLPGFRHMLGKKELGKNKFVNFLCKKLEVILVDRGSTDLSSIRTIVNYLKNGEVISLFPEGTRNKMDDDIKAVKSGAVMFALKADAVLSPIMIYSHSKLFKRNYMYIGKPFDFSEYKGIRTTPEILNEGADKLSNIMKQNKNFLDNAVNNGQIKKLISIDKSFEVTEKLYEKTIKKFGEK